MTVLPGTTTCGIPRSGSRLEAAGSGGMVAADQSVGQLVKGQVDDPIVHHRIIPSIAMPPDPLRMEGDDIVPAIPKQ